MNNHVAQMTERVEILTISSSKQSNGEYIDSTSSLATVWADARPKRGGTSFSGDKSVYTEVYTFLIRHRTDFDNNSLFRYNGKTYDVDFIDPFFKAGRNNYLLVECSYTETEY